MISEKEVESARQKVFLLVPRLAKKGAGPPVPSADTDEIFSLCRRHPKIAEAAMDQAINAMSLPDSGARRRALALTVLLVDKSKSARARLDGRIREWVELCIAPAGSLPLPGPREHSVLLREEGRAAISAFARNHPGECPGAVAALSFLIQARGGPAAAPRDRGAGRGIVEAGAGAAGAVARWNEGRASFAATRLAVEAAWEQISAVMSVLSPGGSWDEETARGSVQRAAHGIGGVEASGTVDLIAATLDIRKELSGVHQKAVQSFASLLSRQRPEGEQQRSLHQRDLDEVELVRGTLKKSLHHAQWLESVWKTALIDPDDLDFGQDSDDADGDGQTPQPQRKQQPPPPQQDPGGKEGPSTSSRFVVGAEDVEFVFRPEDFPELLEIAQDEDDLDIVVNARLKIDLPKRKREEDPRKGLERMLKRKN